MTDSIVLYCPVRPATTDVERLPYKGQIEVDQDGVLGRIQGEAIEVPSPCLLYTSLPIERRVSSVARGRRAMARRSVSDPPDGRLGKTPIPARAANAGHLPP